MNCTIASIATSLCDEISHEGKCSSSVTKRTTYLCLHRTPRAPFVGKVDPVGGSLDRGPSPLVQCGAELLEVVSAATHSPISSPKRALEVDVTSFTGCAMGSYSDDSIPDSHRSCVLCTNSSSECASCGAGSTPDEVCYYCM